MGLHSQIDFKEAKHIDDTQTESFEHCHRISWKIQDGMTPHVLRNWDKGFGDGQRIPSGPAQTGPKWIWVYYHLVI